MIQIGAQASIGGAVKDRIQNLYFESANSSEVKTATLVATSAAGYRFLGWYLNGELISTDASITRSYKFLNHSELLTARFELIPVPPKPDPKPDPKPVPSGGGSGSSAIVEVAAVTNGQITPAVNNVRRNKTPNTGDTSNAIWIFWMMLGLAGAAGSVYMLKED
jgi:LPXTG-motif cell wall-anchored protein